MSDDAWYGEGLRFTCTQCGNCCSGQPGYVWVTREEIRRISEFLGGKDGWLDKATLRRVGFKHSLTERPNGDCVFLQKVNGKRVCSIYPVRPLQCRTWPFWSTNLRSRDSWDAAAETCPGMNKGKHHSYVAIEEVRLRTSWEPGEGVGTKSQG
jgi:uncharacterized protein